jgi:hypothetical protein
MIIDIKHVEKSIERFHLTGTYLAEKASGVEEGKLTQYPTIINTPERIWSITHGGGKPNSDFYSTYIVNSSFSLEMLIKAIIYYESKEWVRGHNLITLFQQISNVGKKCINEDYKEIHKKSETSKELSKLVKKQASITVNWNVASLLSLSSHAFESWRYSFDLGKKKSCFIGYGEIFEALMNYKSSLSDNK